MITRTVLISFLLLCYTAIAQEVSLPADLRQHTLTQYNASLFNPTFSLDRNNPQSISVWTRWQWQQIDADPTSLFVNYSASLGEKSAVGSAFFQHNTGVYFNTGGVVNYAFEVEFNPIIKFSVGFNLFGFQQQLADTRFVPDPDVLPFAVDLTDDFILQLAPGFNLSVENFSLSMASENIIDYNLSDKGANTETSDKIFMGMASYDIPVMSSDSTAFLRPIVYLRTIPEQENQIGMNALFSTQKYWTQIGYNNFYGFSVGAGASLFNRFSLGALVESGTSASLKSKDPSFEIIASYFLGKPQNRRKSVVNVLDLLGDELVLLDEDAKDPSNEADEKLQEDREVLKSRAARAKMQANGQSKDSDGPVQLEKRKAEAMAESERLRALRQLEAQKRTKAAILGADSETVIVETTKEEVIPRPGEKYEEVITEDGLVPGYYLIANVFGTKKYFDAFMQDLRKQGLEPGSFLRSKNNYSYAFLKRYNTMVEARRGRDSNFDGKYQANTWIFRVVGE